MLRREVLALGLFVGIGLSPTADAQRAKKLYRVGVLSPFSPSFGAGPSFEAFSKAIRELGYTEGRDVAFEYRWADGHLDRLPDLAVELARQRVDVIFAAWGTLTALAAKRATSSIPVVFAGVGDAVGVGLVPSLAHPGGNLTGSTFITEETIGKQLQLLQEIVPTVSRVGVVINSANPVYGPILKASEAPARALNLQLSVVGVERRDDFEIAFRKAAQARVDGFVVLRDPLLITNRTQILTFVASSRLPAVFGMREFVDGGGLVSYGPDLAEMYRRAAYLVDKILKGSSPAALPIEQPTRFELVINLKTVRALGLTIPQSVLARADEVIQ